MKKIKQKSIPISLVSANPEREFFNPQNKEVVAKIEELRTLPIDPVLAYFEKEKDLINRLTHETQQVAHRYKFVMKQVLGMCDGEQLDTLTLAKLLSKLGNKNDT